MRGAQTSIQDSLIGGGYTSDVALDPASVSINLRVLIAHPLFTSAEGRTNTFC
jgi:hypothetical protein